MVMITGVPEVVSSLKASAIWADNNTTKGSGDAAALEEFKDNLRVNYWE